MSDATVHAVLSVAGSLGEFDLSELADAVGEPAEAVRPVLLDRGQVFTRRQARHTHDTDSERWRVHGMDALVEEIHAILIRLPKPVPMTAPGMPDATDELVGDLITGAEESLVAAVHSSDPVARRQHLALAEDGLAQCDRILAGDEAAGSSTIRLRIARDLIGIVRCDVDVTEIDRALVIQTVRDYLSFAGHVLDGNSRLLLDWFTQQFDTWYLRSPHVPAPRPAPDITLPSGPRQLDPDAVRTGSTRWNRIIGS